MSDGGRGEGGHRFFFSPIFLVLIIATNLKTVAISLVAIIFNFQKSTNTSCTNNF